MRLTASRVRGILANVDLPPSEDILAAFQDWLELHEGAESQRERGDQLFGLCTERFEKIRALEAECRRLRAERRGAEAALEYVANIARAALGAGEE